jgi:hypothetical protein
MSLDVMIAGTAVALEPKSVKDLKTDNKLVFDLSRNLQPYLDSAIASVPDTGATAINYTSDAASWNPGGSAVTFGLQGGAACSLEIVNSGNLGQYVDGLDSLTLVQVPVPTDRSYVKLMMSFNLSASVSGGFSGGDYGVKAKLSTTDSYSVTFCKAFASTTTVKVAIAQTFEAFVLPFRERLLLDMEDGDYLWYEFDGKIGLAIGAYVGLDTAQYAGNGSADVLKVNGSPLATITASVAPTVKLAKMDFKMDYVSRFEAMLSKVGTSGRLHLMKSDKLSQTLTATAGLMIDVNAEVTLTQKVSDHLADVKTSLVNCVGGPDALGGKAVNAVAGRADDQLNKYAAEVTDKLQGWLDKANGIHCNLQVAIEKTQQKMLLASYLFDLTDPTFAAGWDYALKGDLYGALNTSAVTLEPGSGLEREYRRKTSFRCNFFNMGHMQSWDEFTTNVSMVYAGNNVFHMLAKVGRTTFTEAFGATRGMDIYFSASADAKAGGLISDVDISLNIALNGTGDKRVINTIARLLSVFDSTTQMANLARDLATFGGNAGKHIVQLLVTIPSGQFGRIQSDDKAGPSDQHNWKAFATAADALDAWALVGGAGGLNAATAAFLKQYGEWKVMNMAETGDSSADRKRFGALNTFPAEWATVAPNDSGLRARIKYSMWAAQHYLDFCAALRDLGALTTPEAVTPTWEGLMALMSDAVKDQVNTDFLRPAALATMQLCKGGSYALTAPAGPTVPQDYFSIAIRL